MCDSISLHIIIDHINFILVCPPDEVWWFERWAGFGIYSTEKLFHWWNLFSLVWCIFYWRLWMDTVRVHNSNRCLWAGLGKKPLFLCLVVPGVTVLWVGTELLPVHQSASEWSPSLKPGRCEGKGRRGGGRGKSMTITIPSIRAPETPLLSGTLSLFFMIKVLSHSLVWERHGFKFFSSCSWGLVPYVVMAERNLVQKSGGFEAVNGLSWYLCSCSPGQSSCLPPCSMLCISA